MGLRKKNRQKDVGDFFRGSRAPSARVTGGVAAGSAVDWGSAGKAAGHSYRALSTMSSRAWGGDAAGAGARGFAKMPEIGYPVPKKAILYVKTLYIEGMQTD